MKKKIVFSVVGFAVMSLLTVSMFLYADLNLYNLLFALFISFKKFLLGLTLFKILLLGIKRYVIDNIISKNMKEHFFEHTKDPIKVWWQNVNIKNKLIFFIPASVLSAIGVYFAGISKVLSALGIKAFVIGFFKTLWALGYKVAWFFTDYLWNSWFAPIVEIFILSWLLKLLEKVPFLKNFFSKFHVFNSKIFGYIGDKLDHFIHYPIQRKLNLYGKRLAKYIDDKNNQS